MKSKRLGISFRNITPLLVSLGIGIQTTKAADLITQWDYAIGQTVLITKTQEKGVIDGYTLFGKKLIIRRQHKSPIQVKPAEVATSVFFGSNASMKKYNDLEYSTKAQTSEKPGLDAFVSDVFISREPGGKKTVLVELRWIQDGIRTPSPTSISNYDTLTYEIRNWHGIKEGSIVKANEGPQGIVKSLWRNPDRSVSVTLTTSDLSEKIVNIESVKLVEPNPIRVQANSFVTDDSERTLSSKQEVRTQEGKTGRIIELFENGKVQIEDSKGGKFITTTDKISLKVNELGGLTAGHQVSVLLPDENGEEKPFLGTVLELYDDGNVVFEYETLTRFRSTHGSGYRPSIKRSILHRSLVAAEIPELEPHLRKNVRAINAKDESGVLTKIFENGLVLFTPDNGRPVFLENAEISKAISCKTVFKKSATPELEAEFTRLLQKIFGNSDLSKTN